MNKIIRIETISQIHEMLGYKKPEHPLISMIEPAKIKIAIPIIEQQFAMSFYNISLKTGRGCKIKYGRQYYDFQEGSMIFLSPDQVVTPVSVPEKTELPGWALLFHPDLIRRSLLANKMNDYTFFSYDVHEALHVSEKEKQIVTDIAKQIRAEYSRNLDAHSQDLIIPNLELLLNYCRRFYSRQFITRTNVSKDVVARFEGFLNDYFSSGKPEPQRLPSVKCCAREMGYSANYLSDLLKQETGKTTQEHIHFHLIEKAKNMLLGSEEPIYRIAYALGFEYPQHFSKLFKNETGMSPAKYRN